MEALTAMDALKRNIMALTCGRESHVPFVSCYLNLEREAAWRGTNMQTSLPAREPCP